MKTWSRPWEEAGPAQTLELQQEQEGVCLDWWFCLRLLLKNQCCYWSIPIDQMHLYMSPSSKPAASFPVSVNFLSSLAPADAVLCYWSVIKAQVYFVCSFRLLKTIWIHVVTRNNRHAVLLLQAFIVFMDKLENFSETFIILTCVH